MSSYVPPFPNLTFKTVFTASLFHPSESLECQIIGAFAVTSTSFFNSSLQANVVSRMRIDAANMELIELFLHPPSTPASTTSNTLSTIQMTPVLHLSDIPRPHVLINTLQNSTYFSRSLKKLRVQCNEPNLLVAALENLVALEVLDLQFSHNIPAEKAQELSVIARLPSLIELSLGFREISADECGFFDFLGDLENNKGFRKLSVEFFSENSHKDLEANFARLCARNLLTHLALKYCFTDNDLEVIINARLTNLRFLELRGTAEVTSGKIADAIIASSSSLTTLDVDHIFDSELIKCAEHLDKLVELRLQFSSVNGSFLREKGSCFSATLEILDLSDSQLSDEHLGDGLKYLTSLRKLDLSWNRYFDGASSLQHLTAAVSLEELKLSTITSASLKAVGQLTQLRWLHVGEIDRRGTSDDAAPLKYLVNLRKLTFNYSSAEMYQRILSVAESFPRLEFVQLGSSRSWGETKFSLDQVTYLLERCWPKVRYAEFEVDDADTTIPHLRRRFPHIDLGYENERLVPVNGEITSSCSIS